MTESFQSLMILMNVFQSDKIIIMNLKNTYQLREPILELLKESSRINSYKPQKYWYPLSMATYDLEEILAAIDSLCSFRTTMWEKTAEFERQFTNNFGGNEAIMVNSGSSADLLIAFALINSQENLLAIGDEVLVPSVTWPTQLWSLMMAGLKVRFVDWRLLHPDPEETLDSNF